MQVNICNIQRYSLHDGAGIRTNVFFKGCPLACQWCANPESQQPRPELLFQREKCSGCGRCVRACPEKLEQYGGEGCRRCFACADACLTGARERCGQAMRPEDIIGEAEKDALFYYHTGGGITFTGGEPFAQPRALLELARAAKQRGMSTAVETCGHTGWENIRNVLPYLDEVLYDVKLVDGGRHAQYTGVDNQLILDNLRRLAQEDRHKLIVRVPLISGVNDTDENIQALLALVEELGIERVDFLPYHRLGENKYARLGKEAHTFDAPDADAVERILRMFAEKGIRARKYG